MKRIFLLTLFTVYPFASFAAEMTIIPPKVAAKPDTQGVMGLPQEKREMFVEMMQEMQAKQKQAEKANETLQEQMYAIIRAEKFDRMAFIDVHEKMEMLRDDRRRKGVEKLADFAEKLTPEERMVLIISMSPN